MLHQIKAQQFYNYLGLCHCTENSRIQGLLSDFPVLFKAEKREMQNVISCDPRIIAYSH